MSSIVFLQIKYVNNGPIWQKQICYNMSRDTQLI